MSDWWAQRLGGRQATPQAPQNRTYAPPQDPWYPQGQPQPAYQAPQPQYAPQYQPQGPPKVTMHNLLDAVAHWKGGEGNRSAHRCPGCGSPHLFERGGSMAPQCYECGWNPRFGPQGQLRGG